MPLEAKSKITLEKFKDKEEFCAWVRKKREDDLNADNRNRDRGIEDARYAAGYQWPLEDFRWRRDNNIPALTFNLAPSLLRQRLGARARRRVGPKILPLSPGPQYDGIALIREGLVRNIERLSDISTVDNMVSQNQLISGIGHYEVCIEYADADVFETDIRVKSDVTPWNIIWDSLSTEPTGRDARHVISETVMSREDFRIKYPKAKALDIGEAPGNSSSYPIQTKAGPEGIIGDWITEDTVRVALVWVMREREKTMALMTNGSVVDIGDTAPEDYVIPDASGEFHTVAINPRTNEPFVRTSMVRYAEGTLTNGFEVLEAPYEMEIDRVPVVRVPGWLIMAGDRLERFGMLAFAKDALTFYNYVKSDRIERIVYRNRAGYMAQEQALSSEQEQQFRNSHKLRGAVLKYRGPAPEQVLPPVVDQFAIIETQAAQQSILDILDVRPGLASDGVGTPASGVSLEQQAQLNDSGGIIFDDMVIAAKKEVYRIINQLIPSVYDAPRVAKIIGEDGKAKDAYLNDPENPESVDVTLGKYGVEISTGPSADTQRAQAIKFYETMFNASPDLMGLVAPELIQLLNIPGTDKIVAALQKRSGLGEEELSPEEQAARQQQQQLEQQQLEMQLQAAQLELQKLEADIEHKLADTDVKVATADSERAQGEERRAAAEQRELETLARLREMDGRVELIQAQTEKVLAQITALLNPNPNS